MKMFYVLMVMVSMVGCASRGDVTALASRNEQLYLRITDLENKTDKLQRENQFRQIEIEANNAKIGYLAREVRDMNTSLDRVFKKSVQK